MEREDFRRALGDRMRQAREDRGLTQEAVSRATGKTVATVSRWESGSRQPDIEDIEAASTLYGVSVDSLLGRPEPQEAPASQQEPPPWAIPLIAAVQAMADDVRELRLVLLSGGLDSASAEEEGSEPLGRPSRRREAETGQEAPRLRRSPARRAAESIRLREQLGTPKAREAARRGALGNADVVPEPDAGSLQRPAAGSDRNGGTAG